MRTWYPLRPKQGRKARFPTFELGKSHFVNIRKIIQRRIRRQGEGVNAAGDVHAVIAANVGQGSSRTHVSSRSRQRVVQRSGRTEVDEEREPTRGGADEPAGADRG
jgi:hypothetical protein